MNYGRDEFFRLLDEVESQGGEHLDAVHERAYLTELCGGAIKNPPDHRIAANNCGESALFEIPYEAPQAAVEGRIVVCAKDDAVGRWPRFADANAPGEVI